jgi:hypothetical protein
VKLSESTFAAADGVTELNVRINVKVKCWGIKFTFRVSHNSGALGKLGYLANYWRIQTEISSWNPLYFVVFCQITDFFYYLGIMIYSFFSDVNFIKNFINFKHLIHKQTKIQVSLGYYAVLFAGNRITSCRYCTGLQFACDAAFVTFTWRPECVFSHYFVIILG